MNFDTKKCWRWTGVVFFFLTGSLVSIVNSTMLKKEYPWKYGLVLRFSKPWFTNWLMFSGMALFSFPIIFRIVYNKTKHIPYEGFNWSLFRSCATPSILYIIATVLQNYSLMYMPVTIWQVFFGFQLLFTTLIAVTYRKQQLFLVDWLGLFVSVLGISLSGVAGLLRGLNNTQSSITTIFFMFIIAIFSHGIKSLETILEEQIMHDNKMTGFHLTALEGIWGFYCLTFICLPICNAVPPSDGLGIYENTAETIQQLGYSLSLLFSVLFYVVLVTAFTYFGLQVTEQYSAIHRNMYETVRPLFVWVLSTAARYITNIKDVGEDIDKYSALELTGFFISLLGSLIYNRVLRFPCFIYAEIAQEEFISEEIGSKSLAPDPRPLISKN